MKLNLLIPKTTVSILFLCSIFCVTVLHANTGEKDNSLAYLNWDSGESVISQIVINQQYGDLRLLQSNSNKIKVRAVIQGLNSNAKKIKLISDVNKGILTIGFETAESDASISNNDLRIDTAIFLPEHTKLKAVIEKGKLMTKKISNDLTVESFNSDFDVSSTGLLDLYSQNGNIKAKITSKRTLSSTIKTSKGMISIFFNTNATNFLLKTHGFITSNDWSLMKTKTGKKPNYKMSEGQAENSLKLASDSGNIQLINTKINH